MTQYIKQIIGIILASLNRFSANSLAIYYIRRAITGGIYLFLAVQAWIYIFAPAVAAYGLWTMIGTLVLFQLGMLICFVLFITDEKPTTNQATYKETTQ